MKREVGLPGAVAMGLGSIIGTGLFVSLGIAAGVAGSGILIALALAALLALANGLSSAQLAAAHPVSGGTYEYGYRVLSPSLGFVAGTAFLLAKSASAATAALGLTGYFLLLLGAPPNRVTLIGVAAGATLLLTLLVASGVRRSNRANIVVVAATLSLFGLFLALGIPQALGSDQLPRLGRGGPGWLGGADGYGLLHAVALLFVAFTGYGRIATLGEEVRSPAVTIPRAIWITLVTVTLLYLGVAFVALGTLGAEEFARATVETAAPLQEVARALGVRSLPALMGIAAVTAMLGVLLNLLLGLSRVALAMARRSDLPGRFAAVDANTGSPTAAVFLVGAVIFLLVLLGDVRTTWSFAAFTVLIYYGITNLAALRLPVPNRRYPRWVAVVGLLGCVLLAFQVEPEVWASGTGFLLGALALRAVVHP